MENRKKYHFIILICTFESAEIDMFKKIRESHQYNARHQFMRSFGLECLDRIKKIESKLNQIEWDLDKFSFQMISTKVKSILDAYQLIAHQIYDSCQSVQYDELGHAILKMFLQISSTIKWLIKGLSACRAKNSIQGQTVKQLPSKCSESQKFRNRQISRFVIKGVMNQLNLEQNQNHESWDEQANAILGNKENFQNSKNKILSMGSSNLSIILQDAVDSMQKKSQYIQKFIALRENYQNSYKYDQPLPSQAIVQSQFQAKKIIAFQKFKQIASKFLNIKKQLRVQKCQYGIQVDSSYAPAGTDKIKKAIERNRTKIINQELEKQKNLNKQLRTQIQIYQNKIFALKQSEQLQIVKKNKNPPSIFFHKKILSQDSKPGSLKNDQNSQEIASGPQINQTKKQIIEEQKRRSQLTLTKKNLLIMRKVKSVNYNSSKVNKQISIMANDSYNDQNMLCITPQVFDLAFKNNAVFVTGKDQSKGKNQPSLKLEGSVYSMQIANQLRASALKSHQLIQFEGVQKNFMGNRIVPVGTELNPVFANTPISLIEQRYDSDRQIKNRFQTTSYKDFKFRQKKNNTFSNSLKIKQKNFNNENFMLQSKTIKFQNSQQLPLPFDRLFKSKQIKNVDLTLSAICQFFIDENTAKNYELLNLSEIFSQHKKLKYSGKKTKVSAEGNQGNALCLSSSGFKNIKSIASQVDNQTHSIIAKKIYAQIISTKKLNKQMYVRLILFLRYPFSCIYRLNDIRKKMDEFQDKSIQLSQINSHLKRIWNIHYRCQTTCSSNNLISWCSHKRFILAFFGFQQNIQEQEAIDLAIEESS